MFTLHNHPQSTYSYPKIVALHIEEQQQINPRLQNQVDQEISKEKGRTRGIGGRKQQLTWVTTLQVGIFILLIINCIYSFLNSCLDCDLGSALIFVCFIIK